MTLPAIIEALLNPAAYPEPTKGVELRQTHISYVFLTDQFAYKIKKPVDFGFLDFTTLEKRRFFCEEEVRLNRRLAPEVYLGVVDIVKENGTYKIGKIGGEEEKKGETVEYAVKMKHIAEEAMLNRAVKEDRADAAVVERVARRIADFHAKAERGERISVFGLPEVIRKNSEENFSQTEPYIGKTVMQSCFNILKNYSNAFLQNNDALFRRRVENGFIRDCHGDIHTDHVAITDHIDIIDCIEFNERFRYSDIISDAAFLSMDLEFSGRGDLGRVFERAYISGGDTEGGALLNFYKCYRACVRGKVESFKAGEEEVDEGERQGAARRAMRLFSLAKLYARGGYKPACLVICGLSGTGKSMIANAAAEETGAVRLSSDRVRKELLGIDPFSRANASFGQGIYASEFTEKTYAELTRRAQEELKKGRPVVLDATFSKKKFLDAAIEAAGEANAETTIVLCTAADDVLRQRIEARSLERRETDATWDIFLAQKKAFERIDAPHLVLNTDAPLHRLLSDVYMKMGK